MALTIPTADRISNKYPAVDPTDKTELNADLVMDLLDAIVNGANDSGTPYRRKVPSYTRTTLPANGEAGEIVFLSDDKQFIGFNGVEWVILG